MLKFVLRGHLLDCYEWIYFPYLLEAIAHAAPRNPATDEFVVRGLAMAAERIHKNRKGFRHRHHGVWLMLRSCTRSALLLVAASRAAGGVRDMLPVGWKAAVRGAVEMLAYWRDEAGDARERLRVLEEVVAGMGGVSDSISSSWVRRFIMLARIPRLSLAGFLSPYLAHM